jgi:hypothetical protein
MILVVVSGFKKLPNKLPWLYFARGKSFFLDVYYKN